MLNVEVSGLSSQDIGHIVEQLVKAMQYSERLPRVINFIIKGSILIELSDVQADDPAVDELLSMVEAVLGASYKRSYLQLGTTQLFEVTPGATLLLELLLNTQRVHC